jgi:hypothetical protein
MIQGEKWQMGTLRPYRVLSDNMLEENEGFRCQVSAIKKFQITKHKYQININDRNSKFQTIGF